MKFHPERSMAPTIKSCVRKRAQYHCIRVAALQGSIYKMHAELPEQIQCPHGGIYCKALPHATRFLIKPQQKRVKQHQEMMKSLKKGIKIITNGGIIGTIIKFEGDDIAVVEIAQGVRVRISKSSIAEVTDDKAASGESANDN